MRSTEHKLSCYWTLFDSGDFLPDLFGLNEHAGNQGLETTCLFDLLQEPDGVKFTPGFSFQKKLRLVDAGEFLRSPPKLSSRKFPSMT